MKESLLSILRRLESQGVFERCFEIIFPDGEVFRSAGDEPIFRMHVKTDRALKESITRGEIGFGEAYMHEEIDLEGDVQEVSAVGFKVFGADLKPTLMERVKILMGMMSRRNTLEGSRKNIATHYDLGNDFYSLWLDKKHMQYTCAYFESERDTLEAAQEAKLDLVCRKLRLQPGDTLVEAGCGWGGLGLHAARKYGAKVRSYNISKEQVAFARAKAEKLGVGSDRLEYVLDDYRTIGANGEVYDKFVSVGMLEHVGVENYPNFFDIIRRVVKPNGMALVHSIGRYNPQKTSPWLEKYIFPGSLMPSLSEFVEPVEQKNSPLHVVDVENLRYHYALTLDHWSERFEKNVDDIRAEYGEAFVRMFRLYLRASAAGFRYGGIMLYQVLLSNGMDDGAPMTRHHFLNVNKPARKAPAARNGRTNGKASTRVKVNGKVNGAKSKNGAGRRKPAKAAR